MQLEMQTFGACLREILRVHGVSASALSVQLGFSSRNSLFRILNDETGYEKQRSLLKQLTEGNSLSLSPAEQERLRECLEVSHLGPERYLCSRAMDRLLLRAPFEARDITAVVHLSDGTANRLPLGELLTQLLAAQRVELVLCNFGFGAFFETLSEALHTQNAVERVTIRHYFDATDSRLIRMIAAIRPVLHLPCYHAHILSEAAPDEVRSLYAAHTLCARASTADGMRCYCFTLTGHDRMDGVICDDAAQDRRFSLVMDMLCAHDLDMLPVKSAFSDALGPNDYLQYTDQYRRLEAGCRLYTLKRDVPINFIHPNILLGSVLDGFREAGFSTTEELGYLVSQFADVHLKRWNNFFESHKITHTIFTYEAMRRFAQTGLQSDHFFAMRAYTPAERVAILTHLKEQNAVNPYFNIYFFKPNHPSPPEELSLYEGKGVLLTKPDTDYRLDGGHSETLICQAAFCRQFKEHFLQKLLAEDVASAQETQRLMEELIEIAGR